MRSAADQDLDLVRDREDGGIHHVVFDVRDRQDLVLAHGGLHDQRRREDATEVTCFIPSEFRRNLFSSLEDNGQFTLTVEQIGPHETYQFKGDYIDSRPFEEADRSLYEDCRERFVIACLPRFGITEDVLRRFISQPGLAVRFKVREIFVQTPGPSAGIRLVPREKR